MSASLRKGIQIAAGVAAVVATVAWLWGSCAHKIAPDSIEPVAEVGAAAGTIVAVERAIEPVVERVSGTVASARHTTISAKILARIEDVKVSAGSEVAVGDVLVVLDSRDLAARAREAEQARAVARSQLDLASRERDRAQELFKQGVAARRDLDRTVSAFQVAAAEVERAEQHLRDAEVGRSHGEIRSPVAGRVVDRLAEPGDTATPGVPLLRIYDPSVLRLEAAVRESLAHHLSVGQRVPIYIEAISERSDGEVEEIVPQAETGARTFLVKVRFAPRADVLSGMFGRVEVPAGERERFLVPAAAIERIGQLEFAVVVGEDGRAERRLVTSGSRNERGQLEVLSGLAAGERVRVAILTDDRG
jgi:RND family efflux transporter MFP subunit